MKCRHASLSLSRSLSPAGELAPAAVDAAHGILEKVEVLGGRTRRHQKKKEGKGTQLIELIFEKIKGGRAT